MIKRLLLFTAGVLAFALCGQAQEDWETYVLHIKDRPISIMVDLGFENTPVTKENQNVLIVSLTLNRTQSDGLPLRADLGRLDTLENNLVDRLHGGLGAVYTGRYTSNSKRDFYFYTNDTSRYASLVQSVIEPYAYTFTTICKRDPDLSNYREVLYPTAAEMQRIYNRRMIEHLVKAGDPLTAPRAVDHLIFFKTESDRKKFAEIVIEKRFSIIQAGEEKGIKDRPFSLEVSRTDRVDEDSIEEVSLYLWELALKFGARYEGWETFVVKPSAQ